MQEVHERPSSSSHAVILKAVIRDSHASSANGKSNEEHLPPTIRPRYMTIDIDEPKPRPDMVTCFRRLYMADQFTNANETDQAIQDQHAVRNMRV